MEIIKEVVWTERANRDLGRIFEFNKELHNAEKALNTVNKLIDFTEDSLIKKLDVAVKDQQFSHLREDYKKLLSGDYKITFRSENNTAYIVRVFDMRQHPDKNK